MLLIVQVGRMHIHMQVFQTIPPIIRQLSHYYYLAVISSNFNRIISYNLKKRGLLNNFSLLVGADVIESKVKRLEKCLTKFNIKPSEAVYIGDTAGDIKEAKKVKIKTMAVTWGFHNKKMLKKAKPDFIAEKSSQIVEELA